MTGAKTYEDFILLIRRKTGIDLASYKPQQMERRIKALMQQEGITDYGAYYELLTRDPQHYQQFLKRLTINVTEFMRNSEYFENLARAVLPRLLRERDALRLWSAGCANGAEAYSLAILLAELQPLGAAQHWLLATDIDEQSLKQAQTGIYAERDLRNLEPRLLHRYFQPQPDGRFLLRETIRRRVIFRRHNLLEDPFEKDFDLILCRNVVIYFTPEAKERLYRKFHAALRSGGVLMVGATEPILRYAEYGFSNILPGFYLRKD